MWAWGLSRVDDPYASFVYGTDIQTFIDRLSTLQNCRVYFHNLGFDGSFIFDYLLNQGWDFSRERKLRYRQFSAVISDMNQVYCIKLMFKRGHYVDIYDSLKILPMKLAAVAKTFGTEAKGSIDYNAERGTEHVLDAQELEYLKGDVVILSKALDVMLGAGETKMTAGSNALADFKRMIGGDKVFRRIFPVLGQAEDAFIRQAYRGGFTYANPKYIGQELHYMTSWDVNSLYPSIMYGCHGELMPYGVPQWFEGRPQPTDEYPLWVAQLIVEFNIKPGHIPSHQFRKSFQFIAKEYVLSSEGPQAVTLTNVDFELLCEQYDVTVWEWIGGYRFRASNEIFRPYIDKWTEVKIKAGKEGNGGMRQIAKLKLNSLYGKFGTRPEVQSRYPTLIDGIVRYRDLNPEERDPVYIPVAVFVTSYGRAYTIRFAQSLGDRFVYSDTDSVKCIGLEPPEGAHVDDYALGAWGHDGMYLRFKTLGAKTYVAWESGSDALTIHCSGLPQSCYPYVTMENFEIGVSYWGKLYQTRVKGGIYLREDYHTLRPR